MLSLWVKSVAQRHVGFVPYCDVMGRLVAYHQVHNLLDFSLYIVKKTKSSRSLLQRPTGYHCIASYGTAKHYCVRITVSHLEEQCCFHRYWAYGYNFLICE